MPVEPRGGGMTDASRFVDVIAAGTEWDDSGDA